MIVVGIVTGRFLRKHRETLREPFGVLQAAVLGLVGLILAFGLTLAVGRYEQRRAAVVEDANAIGTAYLRAQTIAEPARTRTLALLAPYTDATILLSHQIPGSTASRQTIARSGVLQRRLWHLAGAALNAAPIASAPRLYVDSLGTMFDAQGVRVAALEDRVPGPVLALEVVSAAASLGLLALYLVLLGRGVVTVLLAGALVSLLLLVTFDLDRPTRGLIRVPDGPIV